MLKNFVLSFVVFLFFTGPAAANDGVFYVQGSTLVPMQETEVELRKEVLKFYIKDFEWMAVDIDFSFFNPAGEKTVTVGFVTPPASGDVDEDEDIHPQIRDFTVNVNGEDLKYQMKRMKDTSFQNVYEDFGGQDFVYYFPVTFKPGETRIRHTYLFRAGGSVETQRDFFYQITTGKRWANKRIDDFELQLHPDLGIFYVPLSFSENGAPADWKIVGTGSLSKPQAFFGGEEPNSRLVQIRDGYLSLKEKNFKPDRDISIGEPNWNMGWHRRMCKSEKKCFEPEEVGLNLYLFFSVRPFAYQSEENLAELSKNDLRIIRNFPYAVRGYDFKSPALKDFYTQFFWYKPDAAVSPDSFNLSEAEEAFIERVLNVEKRKFN